MFHSTAGRSIIEAPQQTFIGGLAEIERRVCLWWSWAGTLLHAALQAVQEQAVQYMFRNQLEMLGTMEEKIKQIHLSKPQ